MKEYKIRIKNEIVTVTEDIYITFYKMDRRERYLNEVSLKKDLSYNHLMQNEYPVEIKMKNISMLLEDEIIQKIMIEKMLKVIDKLSITEKMIINELFFKEKSIRELANTLNMSKSTLHEQKDKILKKLKKYL